MIAGRKQNMHDFFLQHFATRENVEEIFNKIYGKKR